MALRRSTTRGLASLAAIVGVALIAARQHFIGALIALASFTLSGHAATAPPRAVAIPTELIHVAVAAFWIGSFIPLRRAHRAEIVRFSSRAIWLVPILVVAGLVLAVLQVRSLPALVDTGYGVTLLIKTGLVALLLAVALYNRLVITPRLPGAAARLRRSIGVEIALAMAILAATALLSHLMPPRSIAEAAAAPRSFAVGGASPAVIVVSGKLVATIEVSPGAVGRNLVAVHIADPQASRRRRAR